jgi:hypothetical protein
MADQGQDCEKAFVEGMQGIIKAKQEGFQEYFQSVQQSSESRMAMAFKHSENIRDGGGSSESAGFSKEAASMMQ